jgi:hypothetical protein
MTHGNVLRSIRKLATLGVFVALASFVVATTGCSAHAGADVGSPGYVYVGD